VKQVKTGQENFWELFEFFFLNKKTGVIFIGVSHWR
jgi:hypothetical protein